LAIVAGVQRRSVLAVVVRARIVGARALIVAGALTAVVRRARARIIALTTAVALAGVVALAVVVALAAVVAVALMIMVGLALILVVLALIVALALVAIIAGGLSVGCSGHIGSVGYDSRSGKQCDER